MCIETLESLKLLHEQGYVYNNLKQGNISFDNDLFRLLDFGSCLEFKDYNGLHVPNKR